MNPDPLTGTICKGKLCNSPYSLLVAISRKCLCMLNGAASEHCVLKVIELFRPRYILLYTRCALNLDDNINMIT